MSGPTRLTSPSSLRPHDGPVGRHRGGHGRAGAPDRASAGDDPGRRPQRRAAGPRSRRALPTYASSTTRAPAAPPAPATPASPGPRGRSSPSSTTTPRRSRTGSSSCSRRTTTRSHGRGRCRDAGVARPASGPPATGAGLDRRLHLPGPADRAHRRAQPVGLQHVRAARGVRRDRRLRRGRRPDRADPARSRGDRALHPDRPADARRRVVFEPRAVRPPPGHRRPARPGPTCGPARTPRVSPRRPWRGSSGPDDATSEETATSAGADPRGAAASWAAGCAGDVAGFRGAAGIVVCLGTTGFVVPPGPAGPPGPGPKVAAHGGTGARARTRLRP